MKDPITGLNAFVGIAPGDANPSDYLLALGGPDCLKAWSAAVWSAFVTSGIPYSQARLIWQGTLLTGKNYPGYEVFPDQSGGYIGVIDLDTVIAVEWCPQ